jgi:IclR family acetate operon transcriptional repressor
VLGDEGGELGRDLIHRLRRGECDEATGRLSLQAVQQAVLGAIVKIESGETVLLIVPDIRRFVVIDALESRQLLRTVPHIGLGVSVRQSATSRAVLPYMTREQQIDLLGRPPDAAMLAQFAETLKRGYSVSDGDVIAGSTNIAAPILEVDGHPVGAVVVSGPSERLTPKHQRRVGAMVLQTARNLSRGVSTPKPAMV